MEEQNLETVSKADRAAGFRATLSKPAVAGSILAVVTGLAYFFSNPTPNAHFDYTYRMAFALLKGHVGLLEPPPPWLNEVVPLNGSYYTVFPLGSVLTLLPLAALKAVGLLGEFPAAVVVALIAAAVSIFFFLLTARYDFTLGKRIVLTLFPLFGSWMWANLAFAGAWQVTLGFAVLGEVAALYCILIRPNPVLAGLFFAIAFGNRTEVIVVLPIMLYLVLRDQGHSLSPTGMLRAAKFLAIPVALGIATLVYNKVRFGSVIDFGYARIPGIESEAWFKDGLFTLTAIPMNAVAMLLDTWKRVQGYPWFVPRGFGGSIFLSSPFLFLIFTRHTRDRGLKLAAWAAVVILTFTLWIHAGTGGWQFSYRYAMVLLPWFVVLLMEGTTAHVRRKEIVLLVASIAINAWGTYLFLWTKFVTPLQ